MNLRYTIKTSFAGLKANRLRSSLTMLGIIIGIMSIMLITSIGKGAQGLILSQVQSIGSKTIAIIPGRQPKGANDIAGTLFSDSLKNSDLEQLQKKANFPNLTKIMPLVFGSATAIYGGQTYRLTVFGGTDLGADLFDISIDRGVMLSDEDIKSKAAVMVIGSKVKEKLFGASDAVGERIKIKDVSFRVIGVMAQKGSGSLVNFDDMAFIPYTTAQEYILGIKHFNRIIAQVDSEENINQAVRDITITLRNAHNIADSGKDDFFIQTQVDIAKTVSTVTDVLTLFLSAVAAISLLVGGVGIMNIMLVSVTERTSEIGLRKAIGATERNILMQFLSEAIVLTSIGGIIGLFLGGLFSFLFSVIITRMANINWPFIFPAIAALQGLAVAVLVGLIFGLYPARRAAALNPIEALRYE